MTGDATRAADDVSSEQISSAEPESRVYLIGNSLTWDTLPGLLDGTVMWHVDCGKNLRYIYENNGKPCIKSSTLWQDALKYGKFNFLVVQPHFGTSLEEDAAAISDWFKMQPDAVLIIHTGWNRSKDFEAQFHAENADGLMQHHLGYFSKLQAAVEARNPDREIRTTGAIEVLDTIWHEIDRKESPFTSFEELYRDDIHMAFQEGRFLMHNLMRVALGQPMSRQGFQVDETKREYLERKIREWQERSAAKET